MTYAPLGQARFAISNADGSERLTIPAVRNWFLIVFLSVWLTGWTVGGIAAMATLGRTGEPFLLIWLVGWALGWLFATASLIWMLTGREVLRFVGRDLQIETAMMGYSRTRLFRGGDMRGCDVAPGADGSMFTRRGPPLPFFGNPSGSVMFTYGARDVRIAAGLDRAEGTSIATWINRHLGQASL